MIEALKEHMIVEETLKNIKLMLKSYYKSLVLVNILIFLETIGKRIKNYC